MADKKHYDDVFWKTRDTLLDDEDAQPVDEELEAELPRDAELAVIHPERLDEPIIHTIVDEEDSDTHPQADPEDEASDASQVTGRVPGDDPE
ncbi:hypothetical protein L2089_02630 [Paenibacillus hunanensis]|uniref:hypothetical protein n=1 Tax=Paenibacillus hunanensis TaxID=539262 RepID=UPI002026167A|nr:hypothetical protein [Paenibacillus hunanensis]MCL9659563.1 hypothetical protein [Paenibacillus hunanensis]